MRILQILILQPIERLLHHQACKGKWFKPYSYWLMKTSCSLVWGNNKSPVELMMD